MTAEDSLFELKSRTFLSVMDVGARGDGLTDDSAVIQSAYDALAAADGGILFFPRGRYRISLQLTSRKVHLLGTGKMSSVVLPADPNGIAINAIYRIGNSDMVTIKGFSFEGYGSNQGILFQAGSSTYHLNDEYSGGTKITDCSFGFAKYLIRRVAGQIWLAVEDCYLHDCDYCIHSISNTGGTGAGDLMHSGCLYVSRSRFALFGRSMCYLKSNVVGSGQVVFDSCIMEFASGFVFYIDSFGSAEGVPGITIRSCWNEITATGTNIVVEGIGPQPARYMRSSNCAAPILFVDTPVGSMQLSDTTVETESCDLSQFSLPTPLDDRSRVSHRRARSYAGTAPGLCESIAGPTQPSGLTTPWFRMPTPRFLSKALPSNSTLLQRTDGSAIVSFVGSTNRNSVLASGDAALPEQTNSQDITINAGETLYPALPPNPTFNVAANKWLLILYVYKKIAGPGIALQVTGGSGISGIGSLDATDWQTLVGIVRTTASVTGDYLQHQASAATVLRIGGIAVLSCNTRQQAVDMANSLMFPA